MQRSYSNNIDKVILIENRNTINPNETLKSLSHIKNMCNDKNISIQIVEIENNKESELFTEINNLIQSINSTYLTIDITTMSRNIIWTLLFFIKERYNNIKIIYNLPNSYSDSWISRESSKPRLLIKHSGIVDLDKKDCLVIITGFDTDRTKQLVRFYEPYKIIILAQSGNSFNNNDRNDANKHKLVCEELGYTNNNIETHNIDSYSEDLGYRTIDDIIKENNSYNIIFTSLGPKLSAISLYLAYTKNPEIALAYVPCKEYNPLYCIGVGDQIIHHMQIK